MTSASNFIDMQVYDFLGFLESRPDGERWELVGGMPIMMTPPKIAHRRIASNLERALNTAIEAAGLERRADREIGLQIEGTPGYRPEPDIAVIDADYEHERYASRFYGIVEVLSATDLARNPRTGPVAIDDKLAFYRSHSSTEFILVASQDTMSIAVHLRGGDGIWQAPVSLQDAADALDLPRIGSIGTVADMYKGVRL